MNADLFERLLDVYGADLDRWPEVERSAALAHLAASPESRGRWEATRRLEELVGFDRAQTDGRGPDRAREAAITAAALRRVRALPRRPSLDWGWVGSRPVGAVLAATIAGAVLGFLVGPKIQPPPHESVPAIEALLSDGTAEMEGLP